EQSASEVEVRRQLLRGRGVDVDRTAASFNLAEPTGSIDADAGGGDAHGTCRQSHATAGAAVAVGGHHACSAADVDSSGNGDRTDPISTAKRLRGYSDRTAVAPVGSARS